MMFESLEGRALLAGIEVPVASWTGSNFVPSEVMIRFNSNVTKQQATTELFNRNGGIIQNWWQELHLAEVRLPTLFNHSQDQINAIQAIHNWTSVYYAEPNFILNPQRVPNDPGFGQQWGHQNTGQVVNPMPFPIPPGLFPGTPDADTDATNAWDTLVGNPNTIIAIIDTGVDYRHPDLAANIWTNPGEIPDSIDNDGNGYVDDIFGWNFADGNNDPDDVDGHGTHVAGIAAAVGNNGIGVAGVNWNSKIMALKAGNPTFSSSAIVGAQLYISKMRTQYGMNIVVSNNSYGASGIPFSFAQFDAITTASNAGIPFVTAAGNAGINNDTIPDYPSTFLVNGLISVASTDNNDQLSTFSQYGLTTVDLAAPGEQILSTVPPFYNPPFLYDYFDGTSMASPMVAGAVGLLRSLDPTLTVSQVKDFILQGVDKIPNLATRVLTGGRLNIAKSLDLVPRNEIRGTVFLDVNGNAGFDASENGITGWTVYIDLNNNGVLNTGEPSTVTASNGTYLLRGLFGAGTFNIRTVVQATYRQTFPTSSAAQSVTLATKTSQVNNVNFGVQELPGQIHGKKWNDLNGDGVMDAGEPGIQGVVIYVDLNNDAKIGIGEPGAVTDANGNYTIISVPPGTYVVREVYQPGFIQVFPDPTSTDLGANTGVVVNRGTITPNINFGNRAAFDYGDAPLPYPTLINQNGAVHGFLQGFFLGARADVESNGIPSVNADGDDLNAATDDEDGVVIGNLTNNSPQTLSVTASTGSFAAGYLQGWIDFDRDGVWETNEQIFKDLQLTTGTVTLGFTVPNIPANLLGPTYARFRYSLQHGIGPSGSALGGEVEDYLVNILGPNPTAIDDTFNNVADNSLFFENQFHVLNNDLPSTSGPPGLFVGGLNTAGTLGQVLLNDNSTPGDPTDDFYEYQPLGNYVGGDSFKYSVRDPDGNVSNEATVRITVVHVARDPIAVDNTYDVLVNSVAAVNKLDVLANDVEGTGGAIMFLTQTPPTALHGTVIVDTNGTATNFSDDFYRYTPTAGYLGQDSFSYTIVDAIGELSTANVTIQVLAAPRTPYPGAIVQFELQVVDKATNLPLPDGALITLGTSILVRGVISDIRLAGDPTLDPNFVGVFSAYMDLLFDPDKVQPIGPIVYSAQYDALRSGGGGTPGLIDEIGAFRSAASPPSNPAVVFTKEYLTTGSGILQFVADPADDLPLHDITAFIVDPNPLNSKVQAIPSDQVYYKPSFPNISILGSGEGDETNLWNPVDVNLDGFVSPIDALLVVNYLNRPTGGAGEGEDSAGSKRDVNHDNEISPIDALMVINYLNRAKPVAPAGEAEGEADESASFSPIALLSSPVTSGSNSNLGDEAAAPEHAAQVDEVFAQADWTKPSVHRSEDFVSSKASANSDEFFTNLGTAVRRSRKS